MYYRLKMHCVCLKRFIKALSTKEVFIFNFVKMGPDLADCRGRDGGHEADEAHASLPPDANLVALAAQVGG
jgi:hypothetical protein